VRIRHRHLIFASAQDPDLPRRRHRGRPRAHAELREHVHEVRLHGRVGDVQARADLGVGGAVGDEPEHLDLARRQAHARRAHPGEEAARDRGRRA
jgi:hypothetical protein